jgi:hypothetical protein
MNEPGTNLPDASAPFDNGYTVESLRRQMNLLFAGLIITSFTVTAFLGLQARRAASDLMVITQRADEMAAISLQEAQTMQAAFGKLEEFARTHPDFQKQILSRYSFKINPGATPAKK